MKQQVDNINMNEKEDEVESLEITLKDEVANLRVILSYTVFENYDSIKYSRYFQIDPI